MANLYPIIVAVLVTIPAILAGSILKNDKPTDVIIHVTNRTSVPSPSYLVDAVELAKEAYEIYTDDAARAKLWSELFHAKHPECEWNVAVGYTVAILSCDWYIECEVTGAKLKSDKDKSKGVKYLIFSSKENNHYNATIIE